LVLITDWSMVQMRRGFYKGWRTSLKIGFQ